MNDHLNAGYTTHPNNLGSQKEERHMDTISIEATNSTPSISADASAGTVEIRGKSYPENTFEFYRPVLDWLKTYLESVDAPLKVTFEILYFNSSTSQVFYDLF
ncbi:MAG: DUF1987 domain-containing protein, partial [Proteobacteria bacterium]|nr:DUF1987 domain-containing protein [Pseudomonadota bacterium]